MWGVRKYFFRKTAWARGLAIYSLLLLIFICNYNTIPSLFQMAPRISAAVLIQSIISACGQLARLLLTWNNNLNWSRRAAKQKWQKSKWAKSCVHLVLASKSRKTSELQDVPASRSRKASDSEQQHVPASRRKLVNIKMY